VNRANNRKLLTGVAFAAVTVVVLGSSYAQQGPRGRSSYAPVDITEPFSAILRLSAQKPAAEREHTVVLNERYDLSNRPAASVTMDRTKPVQEGVRVKLTAGTTWESLVDMTPEQIRDGNLFPSGFLPLPHPKHQEGGMVFPRFLINEIKRQEGRDLTRFDVDFDIPDHFLPEFPPAIYLNQRSDLGDVSQGQLVTVDNYYQLFNGIINPKQLEGLRLLVTPFPQQQFNQTEDRRSEQPSRGVSCLDCHSNGHTNRATHLAPDARPLETRHRINTPTLRGVFIQRLFGSQRALKTVEDFTEFEQRGAYFDGDDVIAAKKGVNVLERGHQVNVMAEFQAMLAFPPAPKLNVLGKVDPDKATPAELRGQEIFLSLKIFVGDFWNRKFAELVI
jgi:cytochrome c peroxidase